MTIKHIHSSSRFDRTPRSLTNAARIYNLSANLVTYTEIDGRKRKAALRNVGSLTFRLIGPGTEGFSDCGISFNTSEFRLVYHEVFQVSNMTYVTSTGRHTKPTHAVFGVFEENATGHKFVISVVHTPAGIEKDLGLGRKTKAVLTWIDVFHGVRRRTNTLRKRYDAQASFMCGDWNIDFKKAWVRTLVKTMAPNYRLTWKSPGSVVGGTHGSRIIDGTFEYGPVDIHGGAKLFKDDDSSDHRPYIEELSI